MVDIIPYSNPYFNVYASLISPALGTTIGLFLVFRPKELVRLIQLARPMADIGVV